MNCIDMTACAVLQRELDHLGLTIEPRDPTVFVPQDKSYIPYKHRMEIIAQYLKDRLEQLRS